MTQLAARCGQTVQIAGAGKLGSLNGELSRSAADNNSQVVRRARSGPESFHFLEHPWQEGLLVQKRFRFLEQVTLVGRTATFCQE